MRCHVLQLHAIALCKSSQSANLVSYIVFHFLEGEHHLTASESHQIRISRMCAYHNPSFFCSLYYLVHYHRITCMPSAGNICSRHIFNNLFISAQLICAKTFTHVTVQVNTIHPVTLPFLILFLLSALPFSGHNAFI